MRKHGGTEKGKVVVIQTNANLLRQLSQGFGLPSEGRHTPRAVDSNPSSEVQTMIWRGPEVH